jgi:hypothetical protein
VELLQLHAGMSLRKNIQARPSIKRSTYLKMKNILFDDPII